MAIITTIKSLSKAYKALTTSAAAASVASMFALNPLGAAAMAAGMVLTIAGVVKALDFLIDKAIEGLGVDLRKTFFIGDTERDIKTGKAAGCKTILTLSGRTKSLDELKTWQAKPDYIFDD